MAGVIVMLLGVVAAATMRSDGGSDHANTVASATSGDGTAAAVTTVVPTVPATRPAQATVPTTAATKAPGAPTTTKAPGKAPATATPTTAPQPSVQELQQLIAGITAQLQAPPASPGTTAALTKEQIEAKVREELRTKYGIVL